MRDVLRVERIDGILLLGIDNPPVNALSQPLRTALLAAVTDLSDDLRAIAIFGCGAGFIAGADISEFAAAPKPPALPDLCKAIEAAPVPVVSVLHGAVLGGGLEVAMATHVRAALSSAQLGLPEIRLGLIPGSGGTQRLPRLIGMAEALDLILGGRPIGPEAALRLGLIDRVMADATPRAAALALARQVLDGGMTPRRTKQLTVSEDSAALAAARTRVARLRLPAPSAAVEAVAASVGDFDAGMTVERRLFHDLRATEEHAGLRHAFQVERLVRHIPEARLTPRPVASVGVVGGGTMGTGIAAASLLAGFPVTLIERDRAATDRARASIRTVLDGALKRGRITADRHTALLTEALQLATEPAALATADLIVEAVFEDMAVKRDLFGLLGRICKPEAILATNTSFLDIDTIAEASTRPDAVIGLHFFSPAHIMRLVEVIPGRHTAPDLVATGFALAKRLGKVAVRAGNCDGFIGNRMLSHYRKVADYLLIDGASVTQIDTALERFGFAMGPFAVADLAGLDIGWATRKRRALTRPPKERYVAVADRLCENGWFGRKTGMGYYDHSGLERQENPQLDALVAAERAAAARPVRAFSDQDICDRYLAAMVCEGTRVLADGIALRPADIDAVLLFGYGFPRERGGPMHHADRIGPDRIAAQVRALSGEDPYFWQMPPLLERLAETGGRFSDLNKGAAQ